MMQGKKNLTRTDHGITAADVIKKGAKEKSDINAIASIDQNSICVMVWNYSDDDIKDVASRIELTIKGIGKGKVLIHHYRVDQQFSNSFETWSAMGKPQQVTSGQYKELKTAAVAISYFTAVG